MRKILVSICMASAMAMSAQFVVDQGKPENQFEVGVRLGFNSSNVTNNYIDAVSDMKQANNNWQEGLTLGAVVDMNIYKCLAVQTGIIYQRRRSDYQNLRINDVADSFAYYDGQRHANYFQIPILASFRMKINKYIEGQVDFGPYFAYGFAGKDKYTMYASFQNESGEVDFLSTNVKADYFGDNGVHNAFDWGFKLGIGALVHENYYVGIHYDAGARNVLGKNPYSTSAVTGLNKAWNFTIGYNFEVK